MKISIIMPIFNKAKYVGRSIKSLLNQTHKDFELIIIDDGSNDGSEIICDKHASEDTRVNVYHIKNAGVSNARNIGIEKATGEYIQFIDSDDHVDKNMLNDLVLIVEKYEPDIVISGVTKVDYNGITIREIIPNMYGLKSKKEMMEDFVEVQKNTGIYGCVSNKLIKKSIIDSHNLRFDTSMWLAEDLNFYLDLYNYVSKIYFCQKSFYYYLQGAENSSTTSNRKNDYLIQAKIILKEKEMLKKNGLLNNHNLANIDVIISNFIMSYIYDNFDYNDSKYMEFLEKITENNDLMASISYLDKSKFDKIILRLLSKKNKKSIFILFYNRNLLRRIYRKIKREGGIN